MRETYYTDYIPMPNRQLDRYDDPLPAKSRGLASIFGKIGFEEIILIGLIIILLMDEKPDILLILALGLLLLT